MGGVEREIVLSCRGFWVFGFLGLFCSGFHSLQRRKDRSTLFVISLQSGKKVARVSSGNGLSIGCYGCEGIEWVGSCIFGMRENSQNFWL